MTDSRSPATYYDEVGGAPTFQALVHRFYQEVAADEILRPMYPEDDLEGAERRLRMFLEQYWGGPHTYNDERGHPRLRLRHAHYTIGEQERDAWLRCMRVALDSIDEQTMGPRHREAFVNYIDMAAETLVNAPD